MSRSPRDRLRRIVLGLLAVGVALLAYAGWRVWQVTTDLEATREGLSQVEASADAGDMTLATGQLEDLQEHAADVRAGTSGAVWSVLTHVPVLGDDARAVRVLGEVAADLADEVAPPMLDLAADVDAGRFGPVRGRIPIGRVSDAATTIATASAALDEAIERLGGVDGDLAGPVAEAVDEARGQLDAVAKPLRRVRVATRLLPPILGAQGERDYLLVVQNNAEIRSTGGFPGSVFLLRARQGRVTLSAARAGAAFPHLDAPVVALTPAEDALFGERAGTWFVDANEIPSFARAAQIWAAHWERETGTEVDGVLAADPVALSYLLGATGPVGVDGVELTSESAVAELLSTTYQRYPDPADQDRFFRDAGAAVFAALLRAEDLRGLVEAASRAAGEQRLLFSSFDRAEQRQISRTTFAGPDRARDAGRPQVGVYLSDTTGDTGSKLSYYLRYDVALDEVACGRAQRRHAARLDLRLETPPDPATLPAYVLGGDPAVPPGDEDLYVLLIGPRAGTIDDLRRDGSPVPGEVVDYDGRPAIRIELRLAAGGRSQLTWVMTSPARQQGDVDLALTPSVTPGPPATVVSGCASPGGA